MNYIGIDIGSTASKVAVKGDHDLHFVLPTGWSSKETCQTIRAVYWKMVSMCYRTIRKLSQPDMAVLP